MPKLTVAKKAARDITHRAKTVSRCQDKMWNEAYKAPMFATIKIKERLDKKNKKVKVEVRRAQRLIGGHTYQISAAGVAQAIAREQQLECKRLGIKFARPAYMGKDREGNEKEGDESKGVPLCQAQFSPGYKCVVEQFVAAYVQEVVETARETMQALHKEEEGKKKRLNRKIMHLACTEVNANIFGASALAPRDVYVVPLPMKKVKKEGEGEGEGDYQPPSAEEQAEDEAAADVDGADDGVDEGAD